MTNPATNHATKGIALMISAVFFFALADVATKHLVQRYNVPLVVGVRYGVNLLLLLAVFVPRYGRALFHTQRTGLVMLRGLCLAGASLFLGLALRQMPLAETMAIVFLTPIGVLLLAGPVLGEKVGLPGWVAAVLGFIGVLLIVRPGGGLAPWGVIFAIATAMVSVIYNLLSRVLARSESTSTLLVYTALVGTVIFSAMAPWYWSGPIPTPWDYTMFLGLGALATLGHFLFTAAFREAPAGLLAPVNYVHLVWAGIFGWAFFGHLPNVTSTIGISLIALAGIGIALYAQFKRPVSSL